MIKFHSPLYALLFIPLLIFFLRVVIFKRSFFPTVRFPFFYPIKNLSRGTSLPFAFYIKIFAIIFLIIALMRPQKVNEFVDVITEGVDIILTIDTSGSMQAMDFKPKNRLEVAKDVIENFINGRKGDRIGLVVFAARAVTLCPLTIDYQILTRFLGEIHTGILPDGTAIGDALGVSINRIKEGKAKSKVVILITDGVNNTGEVSPLTAAEIAKENRIKVYTIGVGTNGVAPIYVRDPYTGHKKIAYMKVEIDEKLLKKIAKITGGKYFRATDSEALKKIFKTIDSLEKTKMKAKYYYNYKELFYIPLLISIFLILLGVVIEEIISRRLP